ncbi:BTB/POZ domain-containing protein KCTD3 [Araneus ventricosus]|uniref:BTB/POZ domain-containing protein KCTD3 n=1 Tax=Araneus ventricosus TaxID=182803 RepID=A0A4Y2N0D0_ARAVE|nr:BTB/POZ domain-containing protein KCTD3 [Araneus ventricosus]
MKMCHYMLPGDIIRLNVGGTRLATSRQTLTWVPDSFFTSMLSGRISTLKDETGAIFIDRDPKLFNIILNFMRTKDVDLSNVDISTLRHEAEFYGISPLAPILPLIGFRPRLHCFFSPVPKFPFCQMTGLSCIHFARSGMSCYVNTGKRNGGHEYYVEKYRSKPERKHVVKKFLRNNKITSNPRQ